MKGKKTFLVPIDKKGNFEVIKQDDSGKITRELYIEKDVIKGENDGRKDN